jgi:hypothetical protein
VFKRRNRARTVSYDQVFVSIRAGDFETTFDWGSGPFS